MKNCFEVGRYLDTGEWDGWVNPNRDAEFTVPVWVLFIRRDGTVVMGIRDDETDELEFA